MNFCNLKGKANQLLDSNKKDQIRIKYCLRIHQVDFTCGKYVYANLKSFDIF